MNRAFYTRMIGTTISACGRHDLDGENVFLPPTPLGLKERSMDTIMNFELETSRRVVHQSSSPHHDPLQLRGGRRDIIQRFVDVRLRSESKCTATITLRTRSSSLRSREESQTCREVELP